MKRPTLQEYYEHLDEVFTELLDWENWQYLRRGQVEMAKDKIIDSLIEDAHEYGHEYVAMLKKFQAWGTDANQLTRRVAKPEMPGEDNDL